MALAYTLPEDQNPIDVGPLPVYIRAGNISGDEITENFVIEFGAYTSKEAFDAGKAPVGPVTPLAFIVQPQPSRPGVPAVPSYAQLRAVFAAEFDFMIALSYELAKRYSPVLKDATEAEPTAPQATRDEINARLNAAGL